MTRIWSASRMVDSRWAMTSEVRPASAVGERPLDGGLGLGVQVGGGLVEDHDGGRLQQQPGQGDALLLAAGQPVAAVAHDRVQAVGQHRDQVPDLRRPARLDQFLLGGPGRA